MRAFAPRATVNHVRRTRHRLPEHLQRWKFPKRYVACVEECARIDVPDLIAPLTAEQRRTLEVYVPPAHPSVVLVRGTRGVLHGSWWWLLCPRCTSHREYLLRLPKTPANAWACRRCLRLTRATTRYRPGHPLRARLTHRATIRVQREARRWQREAQAQRRAQERAQVERQRRLDRPRTLEDAHQAAELAVREHVAELREQAAAQLRRLLVADAVENAATLARYVPGSKSPRARAARLLDHLARTLGDPSPTSHRPNESN